VHVHIPAVVEVLSEIRGEYMYLPVDVEATFSNGSEKSSKQLDNQHAANVSDSDGVVSHYCTNNATETTVQHCWQPTCSNVQNTAFHRCTERQTASHTHARTETTVSHAVALTYCIQTRV